MGEVLVGVVIVCDNQIIVCSYNYMEQFCDVIVYVEIIVLMVVVNYFNSKYLIDCMFYVIFELCVMCVGVLVWV